MFFSPLFAAEKFNIDPDVSNAITGFGLFFMGMVLVMGISILAWHTVPALVTRSRNMCYKNQSRKQYMV